MFDTSLAGPTELAGLDDAALIETITRWSRMEATAAAHRLAAIGELVARRTTGNAFDRSRWSCDNWDSAAAEIAAAEHTSHALASSQMYLASALRDRIPTIGALFLTGRITARLASTIAWHTTLITDPTILAHIDTELADIATSLGPLSGPKTATAIDALIERHDPAAVRRYRDRARSRDLIIDTHNSHDGITDIWGHLFAVDATALDQRLTQLAHSVCDNDPRTLAQRRADALGALATGATTLACTCGNTDCPATTAPDTRATSVVVHVLTDTTTTNNATPDPHLSGDHTPAPAPEPESEPAPEPAAKPARPASRPAPAYARPGHLIGGGTIPSGLLAQFLANGAHLTPLAHPGDFTTENNYRPSTALAAFIRARDLTCRFPGCDRPATHCDIDHAIPHPHGPTHPANLRCLCRKHHLLKTFWTGPDGWHDHQHPDGTIDWTSPTGHTYTTRPGSQLLYPTLTLPTQPPPTTPTPPPTTTPGRGLMMPTRTTTRAQNRQHHINTERTHNLTHHNKPPP
ncbi:DUF222 domain-containing protein [[Mycobacterium] kokjensenii]|uniref:DUF222 domain-containing protein n=1 Tax=[Mycobacterium] kokjensenii TaxID=3064287 RepID=A0ABM9LJK2_9MYCO|nr:HNH endonuclease signature motif containing protein [Mycolicibacter sp. MU0083]CAJ1500141.1 DUF222 domain-containing protein [Mycolicibacter sp. MU0083]